MNSREMSVINGLERLEGTEKHTKEYIISFDVKERKRWDNIYGSVTPQPIIEERFPNIHEVEQWIKYKLLFYKPLNDEVRFCGVLLLHQTYDPKKEDTLLCDELENFSQQLQDNFHKIVQVFEPEFDPDHNPTVQYPRFLFDYIMGIFIGERYYDEKGLKGIGEGYNDIYLKCEDCLKENEISIYVEKKQSDENIEKNAEIEKFLTKIHSTFRSFKDSQDLEAHIYKIANKYLKPEKD